MWKIREEHHDTIRSPGAHSSAARPAPPASLRLAARASRSWPCRRMPVALNVIDVAGNLALTQKAIENYRKAKPNLVSRITFTKAPAPELPGKLKAQQDAGRVDIDLVLTGTDALVGRHRPEALGRSAARLTPASLPKLDDIYLPPALRRCRTLGQGQGVVRHLLPVRPAARIHARQGEDAADHGRGAARLGQGQPEPLHLCAPGQFRPRPHLHDGPALSARRQGSEGPGQGLGQDLGLSSRSSARTSSTTRPAPARR